LLDNAIKFSNQDGAIKLYSQNVDSDFVILLLKIGLGMDESTRQELLKETVAFKKKKKIL
jgi:signal transduction histidine kinase